MIKINRLRSSLQKTYEIFKTLENQAEVDSYGEQSEVDPFASCSAHIKTLKINDIGNIFQVKGEPKTVTFTVNVYGSP